MIVIPNSYRRELLNDLKAAGPPAGDFNGAKVRLFKQDMDPTPDTTLAQLDAAQADFTGYAESTAIVWSNAYTNSIDQAVIVGDTKVFAATGSTTTNTIYGYYVVDSAGTKLLYAEKFETGPIPVLEVGHAVPVVPIFTFGQ
jgi:hypothetical protein